MMPSSVSVTFLLVLASNGIQVLTAPSRLSPISPEPASLLQEEAHILASLDADVSNPWVTSRAFGDLNQGKAYGFVTDLRRRCVCLLEHSLIFPFQKFWTTPFCFRIVDIIPLALQAYPKALTLGSSVCYCFDFLEVREALLRSLFLALF